MHTSRRRFEQTRDESCNNCLALGNSCTYLHAPVKRGPKNLPPRSRRRTGRFWWFPDVISTIPRLIQDLKQKIATLEARLSAAVCSLCAQPLQTLSPPTTTMETTPTYESDQSTEDDDTDISEELSAQFRKVSIQLKGFSSESFGQVSNMQFVRAALAIQEKHKGHSSPAPLARPIYWDQTPWEKEFYDQQPCYIFPDPDLVESLLALYFTNFHPTFPLLHRDFFRQQVAEGLHLTNTKFGALLLAVLAVASRDSNDPRVTVDGNTLSSGWRFITQVQPVENFFDVTIHDLQFNCLMTLFYMGTSAPHTGWLYLGFAIRFLQYRGEHDRKRHGMKVVDELWNRAFWCIFILDRMISAFLGRPPALHKEDYYVDPPLEVDDEYWDHGFVQPLGKPSALSFFVNLVRLAEIMGDALRRLHNHPKLREVTAQQDIVAELDSLMNNFIDTLPSHLRWDPNKDQEGIFFDQAAMLHATYCYVQIVIHRPFMNKQISVPSTIICTTAARVELSVAEIWTNKLQRVPSPFLQNATFASAVVLLINIFSTRHAKMPLDVDKDRGLVEGGMKVLQVAETRWHAAGRRWELLNELQSLFRPSPTSHRGQELSCENSALGLPLSSYSQRLGGTNHQT
ncbi:fungal-specific transcription factor domain-containing protein [Roridomyces roridus]|uniref:Fungal-specific transcription factor domain-containing protein n=1 Tax=Roridomyces roridus TaxID=1738132 RepID=A0AAD7FY92_9AGAR|nr:fungal-specific transcription factor domain-containing protein [Roridomyces roridus]